MNQRTLLGRLLSPAGFGLVLLLFLLPFVTVSCGNETPIHATFTGMDMIVGGQPTITGEVGGEPVDQALERELTAIFVDDLDLQPLALLAMLAALLGMGVGLIRFRVARHAISVALALTACALMVAAMLGVARRVTEVMQAKLDLWGDSPPPTAIHPRFGFWLAVAGLGALAFAHAAAWIRARHTPSTQPEWAESDQVAPDGEVLET